MTRDNGDPPTAVAADTPSARVRIDRIRVAGSRLNFTDHFIRPNYTADVGDIDGTITGLSSERESRGVVALAGRYDTASPVLIGGTVNPLRGDLFADIQAKGTEIDLPKLSAYSQRYAGYGITKGKLSLDVQYKVDGGKLEGRNKIALQQLTFGERVESPDATKLPVLFAASLLKDADGNIDIELPISGSLEDPQFNVGGLVAGMLGKLLSKAVTSPFSLLAAAFGGAEGKGGGDELSYVQFAPGEADVTPAEEQKLGTLSKALRGRPGLTLEIAAHVDPATDAGALKRIALERRLRAVRVTELAATGKTADPESLALTPEDYLRLVRAVFVSEKLGEKDADLSAAAMEERLLERMTVSQEDLEALARRRAARVKEFLVDKGQLPGERLVVAAAADNAGPAAASRVAFTLK